MQRLEVSFAVRPIWGSLGVKWLSRYGTFGKVVFLHAAGMVKSFVGACPNFLSISRKSYRVSMGIL